MGSRPPAPRPFVDPSLKPRVLTGLSSGEGLIWAVRDPTSQDPGHQRSAAARDRARVRQRLEGRKPRDLDAIADTALRMGRSAAGDPDPHRPRARHQRAHRAHRPHHPARAPTAHHASSSSPTATSTGSCSSLPPPAAAPRRRQPRPAARHRPYPSPRRHAQARPHRRPDPPRPGRPRALAARLPPARRAAARRDRRSDHRPRRAHTIRLALLYALTDGQQQISPPHLTAALALWDYATRSAAWALTGATGQPLAEQIYTVLRQHPGGLTRSQISQTLNHNQPASQIDTALSALHATGRATVTQIPTGGRPAQLWTATSPSTSPRRL